MTAKLSGQQLVVMLRALKQSKQRSPSIDERNEYSRLIEHLFNEIIRQKTHLEQQIEATRVEVWNETHPADCEVSFGYSAQEG